MHGKVLIIVHQDRSTPGRIGLLLRERGHLLDIRRPCLGHPLPDTLDGHDGVVVFGGPMSVNDGADFIRRETEWLALPLKAGKPLLGICLGAQMLARHLGAKVTAHPEGLAEIGYYPIHPTAAGRRFGPWPTHVYQWHQEGFELPCGATLLAEGVHFQHQAFHYGEAAFGIQFHPEITLAMLHRWTVRGAHRFALPGAQNRAAHFEGRMLHDPAVRAWLVRFLDGWLPGPRHAAARA